MIVVKQRLPKSMLLGLLATSIICAFSDQAHSQYSNDPGVAYGQNMCLLMTENGFPLRVAAGVAASPMLGFQGPSRAIALRNGNIIMMYMAQFNGNVPKNVIQKMSSTAQRWLVKNCRNGLSQEEYNSITREIKAGKI